MRRMSPCLHKANKTIKDTVDPSFSNLDKKHWHKHEQDEHGQFGSQWATFDILRKSPQDTRKIHMEIKAKEASPKMILCSLGSL